VLDGRKRVERLARDPLGGGVVGDQVGKLLFQVLQLMEQAVVVRVGDLRAVFDVVEIVVVADVGAQLGDPLGGFLGSHRFSSDTIAGDFSIGEDGHGRSGTGKDGRGPAIFPP
jgi:hypothetical protein